MIGVIKRAIEKRWYSETPGFLVLLMPLMFLYMFIFRLRKMKHLKLQQDAKTPLIIIGNIVVGGTGKTPVIIALARYLREKGLAVGIVSRGYGRDEKKLELVSSKSTPEKAGDEPIEIWQALNHNNNQTIPMAVASDRVAAVAELEKHYSLDVVLSDDGLQHYKMSRQIEVCVVNQHQGFGNAYCLPVGPLRETLKRLESVDFILLNSVANQSLSVDKRTRFVDQYLGKAYFFSLKPRNFRHIKSGKCVAIDKLPFNSANAIAGIGQPSRFFKTLRDLSLNVDTYRFPDHHRFKHSDFFFGEPKNEKRPIIMTAKDSVKCMGIAPDNSWCLNVDAVFNGAFFDKLYEQLMVLSEQKRNSI